MQSEGGLGPNIVSPMGKSTDLRDPLNAALLDTGAHVDKLGRKVGGSDL